MFSKTGHWGQYEEYKTQNYKRFFNVEIVYHFNVDKSIYKNADRIPSHYKNIVVINKKHGTLPNYTKTEGWDKELKVGLYHDLRKNTGYKVDVETEPAILTT